MINETGIADDFEGLRQHHRDSAKFQQVLVILLIAFATITAVAAFLVDPVWQLLLIPLAALSAGLVVLPWLALRERYERIEGLSVLEDEWRDVQRNPTARPGASEEMIELLWSMYDSKKRG